MKINLHNPPNWIIPICLLFLGWVTVFYSDNYYDKIKLLKIVGEVFTVISAVLLLRGYYLFKRYGKRVEIPFMGYLALSLIVLVAFFLPELQPKDPRITEDLIKSFTNGYTFTQVIPTYLYTVVFLRIAVLVGTNK